MFPWKRILCPVDFSPSSRTALAYAADLCRESGGTLVALHVLEPIVDPGDYALHPVSLDDLEGQLLQRAREALDEQVRTTGLAEDKALTRVERGPAPSLIVRIADEEGAELIVIGSRGLTGIGHLILGSTAERVVRGATCPVMTVREPDR
jgi:nucleotide-binding universal stress UspA family protein